MAIGPNPRLVVNLEGDDALADLRDERWVGGNGELVLGRIQRVFALPGGMRSGLPSAGIAIELPDGSWAVGETSARALVRAADAIRARYPQIDAH